MKLIEKVRETAKVLKTLSRKPRRPAPKRLQARVRATTAMASDNYEEEEPQTKLTSAFVVVLILHLVAVGGIYAFQQIKASRKTIDAGRVAETPKQTTATAATTTASAKEPERVVESGTAVVSNPVTPAVGTVTPAVVKAKTYTVKSGDTLHGIAKAAGLSVTELKAANGLTGDGIRPGQTLNLVPGKTVQAAAIETPQERPENPEPKTAYKTYTVKSGDRLVFIAKRFSVNQEDLMALNKIKDPSKLQIGQTLKIPSKK